MINSDDEPALLEVSPQVLNTLKNNGYLKPDAGMTMKSAGAEQHLRARVDNLEDRIKRLEAGNKELLELLAAANADEPAKSRGRKG